MNSQKTVTIGIGGIIVNENLVSSLQTISIMLAMIPIEELEQHIKVCQKSLSDADSIGVMLDPTAWMRARADGSMEDARNQLAIVEHLLEARRAIDVREAFVNEKLSSAQQR